MIDSMTEDFLENACAAYRGSCDCVLSRLEQFTDYKRLNNRGLLDVAGAYGLTDFESYGLMDGWDCITASPLFQRYRDEEGYRDGFEVGKRLALQYAGTKPFTDPHRTF